MFYIPGFSMKLLIISLIFALALIAGTASSLAGENEGVGGSGSAILGEAWTITLDEESDESEIRLGDAVEYSNQNPGGTAVEEDEEVEKSFGLHFVERGDTLWQLARKYETTVGHLQEVNNLPDADRLVVGQPLLIPAHEDVRQTFLLHLVEVEKDISELAAGFDLEAGLLMELNQLDEETLTPGMELIVPEPQPRIADQGDGGTFIAQELESAPGLILPGYRILVPREEKTLGELLEGFEVEPERVSHINGIEAGDKVQPGQKIILPTEENGARLLRFYMVQADEESLSDIAKKFRFDYDWLVKVNRHIEPRGLEQGEVIYLPSIRGEVVKGEIPFESLTGDDNLEGDWDQDTDYSEHMTCRVLNEYEETLPRPGGQPVLTPEIDFDGQFLIYTYLGEYPTTGYDVGVDRISQENGRLTVHLKTRSPGRMDVVGQAITHPYTVAAVSREDLLVRGMLTVRFVDQDGNLLDSKQVLLP